ncbi:CHAT domain-containing protein [Acrocarpospora catenulata]|uniref:CHAT domain-containing protein n=1 Tax=Acrocarpospora catenulata TaxID=2836182 RepID=UPI001BDA5BB0|nr:CHAT domain-containing protein [Acrocarpospora catenulata]
METTALDLGDELLRLAEDDPARLTGTAAEVSAAARERGDLALLSVVERALGVAAHHLDDLRTAAAHQRAAMALARRAHSPALAAEARIRLAFVLSLRGRSQVALREIEAALPDLHGAARARGEAQRAAVYNHLGRREDALAVYRVVIPALRRAGDHVWLQRVLSNRAIVYGYQHRFAAAEADLREAQALCEALGLDLSLAVVRLNLGWVSAQRGDVPTALGHFDAAEERFRALGTHQLGWLLHDRAELLLSAGLVTEARAAAEQSVEELRRRDRMIGLSEVRLLLARTATLQGDHERALAEGRRAVAELARQRRPEWSALAKFAVLRSRTFQEPDGRGLLGALERSADRLAAAGWPHGEVEARLLAARLAFARGHGDRGRRQLEGAATARLRGPALLRSRGWHAEALLRGERGNPRGAYAAVRSGLRILDEHRATLTATDLRGYGFQYRAELTALGLRMAVRRGRPERVFHWAEQGRASHLMIRPARAPEDPALTAALAELRTTMSRLNKAGAARGPLVERQIALERQVRDLSRRLPPSGAAARPAAPVPVAALREALDGQALVEYFQVENHLHAVTLVDGRLRTTPLAPLTPVGDLIDRIPFALRRLNSRAPAASRAAAEAMLTDATGRLDAILLGPLAGQLGDRPLTGPRATAARVLSALDGARLAHLAAHGRLHGSNPLFSSLRLADGPLTIYDLEGLRHAPRMVVLAACDSGRSVVRTGDELLGLSATFLSLGTRTIIAPVVSVPDAATAAMMVTLHRLLLSGLSAAAALAQTQADHRTASAGFVCMGADTFLPG